MSITQVTLQFSFCKAAKVRCHATDLAFILVSASSLQAVLGTHLGSLHLSYLICKKKIWAQSTLKSMVDNSSAV